MLPFVYGFTWNPGTVIFLGAFFSVVAVMAATLTVTVRRALTDVRSGKVDTIRWHADFHDLPPSARTCRHELTGECDRRTCPNGFDCRECTTHAQLVASRPLRPQRTKLCQVEGFDLPMDRMYHRGHTWVRPEEDGTVTIGLDEMAKRLIGSDNPPELPEPGTQLFVNGAAWRHVGGPSPVRILSPVDGVVEQTGTGAGGWLLRVKTGSANLEHLLMGDEAVSWFKREYDRLRTLFADPVVGPTMADGGTPVQDFPKAYPKQDWDSIYGDMFLEA